ncbi:MAG TPA: hypothetical protein VLV18_09230 [Terriglobales bacterium]|nr:hypothetical protein [Terriglobales bacterium]
MRPIAIVILAVILAAAFTAPVHASNLSVSINGQQVRTNFNLYLHENITSLPVETANLDATSNSNLNSAFSNALHATYPTAAPSSLTLQVTSTKNDLNITGKMSVSGVSNRTGDIVTANMTWLPFNVASDLTAGNLSYNLVGSSYFKSIVAYYGNESKFVGRPNATIAGVSFFVNASAVNPEQAENYVGNFTTLNFAAINPSLDQWNRTYTLNNDTTTWRYPSTTTLDFDMKIQVKNVTTHYVAAYQYSAAISVPGVGRSQETAIFLDVGNGETEWVMAAVVVIAIISAVGAQFLLRSRKKKATKFQRR